jgi:2-keto-4-pentenoate hydratase/2-oxohepta-3-ene-1,7-dioic acid hydratase in catechol pathway
MRLVSYGVPGREKAGVLIGERVVPCEEMVANVGTMRAALAEGNLARLQEKAANWSGRAVPLSMLRLGPPVPDPRSIICVGLNYRSHALEQKKPWPKQPLLFAKSQNALAGPRDDVTIPENDPRLDYEVELAVVIGARTHRAEPAQAMAAVAGYMVANDLSARRWQHEDGQWYRAKSCDGFLPCGPAIVTPDEAGEVKDMRLTTHLGGELMQDAAASELIHGVPALIAYISRHITLEPGDVICTGTPAGVGCWRTPPRFLAAGETITCAISGVGELVNRLVAPA